MLLNPPGLYLIDITHCISAEHFACEGSEGDVLTRNCSGIERACVEINTFLDTHTKFCV